ncbi:hypothetical protein Zmor_015654 [Zophobas morio]|uniref:DNA/RNA non-specific endonuclease/pyrophosphatase/phosphodiesterase domain-containing protein n=1 Tax=Zophobas morio TaxID=2755281 RepID=A0AA38MGR3_9CUCU|nr:hypothetical protein Zmor_015654 [Zophobas morio]
MAKKISFTVITGIVFVFLTSLTSKSASQSHGIPDIPSCYVDVTESLSFLIVDENYQFPNVHQNSVIHVFHNAALYWACPEGQFNSPGYNVNGQVANCRGGGFLNGQFQVITHKNLTCTLSDTTRPALTEIYDNPNIRCEGHSRPVEVGYTINREFARVLVICFQMDKGIPLYTKYTITKWARLIPNYRPPPSKYFFSGDLISGDVSHVYSDVKASFENLGFSRHINETYFVQEGRLASSDELLYPFQRDATYNLANVAPQWNTFDESNWWALEQAVVDLVTNGDVGNNATVLTGTLKVSTLNDWKGVPVELYLQDDRFPVPRWFWKLVFFPDLKFGAIFFGYNNIYDKKIKVDAEFLREICHVDILETIRGSWSLDSINNSDQVMGYIYACGLKPEQIIDPLIREIVNNALNEFGTRNVDVFDNSAK